MCNDISQPMHEHLGSINNMAYGGLYGKKNWSSQQYMYSLLIGTLEYQLLCVWKRTIAIVMWVWASPSKDTLKFKKSCQQCCECEKIKLCDGEARILLEAEQKATSAMVLNYLCWPNATTTSSLLITTNVIHLQDQIYVWGNVYEPLGPVYINWFVG